MRDTSSSQFVMWCEFFRRLRAEKTVEHYYLAQIAKEVHWLRYCWVKHDGQPAKLEDFLLEFDSGPKVAPVGDTPEEEEKFERQWTDSRNMLLAHLGVPGSEAGKFHIDLTKPPPTQWMDSRAFVPDPRLVNPQKPPPTPSELVASNKVLKKSKKWKKR